MKPLKNYVLVKEAKEETTTASGIVLTGAAERGSKAGVVQAVGPDTMEVKVGDKVALAWDKGLKIDSNSVLVSEEFILGVY